MSYYKRSQTAVDAYNANVARKEGYKGITSTWSRPIEINGDFFIEKHPKHPSADPELSEIQDLPNIPDPTI